jgi:hypothetical protein
VTHSFFHFTSKRFTFVESAPDLLIGKVSDFFGRKWSCSHFDDDSRSWKIAPQQLNRLLLLALWPGVARFFLVQHTKKGKIFQMATQNTKWPQNIPSGS